jgi:hypothetical protein
LKKTSPTERTLRLLRKQGWTAQIVERWNPYGGARVWRDGKLTPVGNRVDLFGVIDVLAVRSFVHGPASGVLGVQCTTRDNQAARLGKALATPALRVWLAAGGRFEIWGWAKVGAAGTRKLWAVSVRVVTLAEVAEALVQETV